MTAYLIAIGFDVAAFLADKYINAAAAGLLLAAEAMILGIYFLYRDRCLVSFRVLLSLSWIGGEALAALKASYLMKDWTLSSWLSFSLFYILFLAGYDLAKKYKKGNASTADVQSIRQINVRRPRLLHTIIAVTLIPWVTFVIEACLLGYIPLFSDVPHAYDHFHMTGIHYFTVSGMFTPGLSVLYLHQWRKETSKKQLALLIICNLAALALPVMMISKFQFLLMIVYPAVLYLLMKPRIPKRILIGGGSAIVLLLAAAAVFMTINRHYEEGYLNSIFEMKNSNLPVALQYIYMYVANNYANFNELTLALSEGSIGFSHGLKQLFPVIALTGLKFLRPELVNFVQPVTKTELTTLTLIYDAYYDFGLIGVLMFGLVLGACCRLLSDRTFLRREPGFCLLYGQIAIYLMLSFFSSWFTVPTTWFWFAVTLLIWLATRSDRHTAGIENPKNM